MVAEFPNFSRVTLEDKQFFDEFNAQFSPYADWAFGTLLTWWDAFDDLEVSLLNNNIVIKSSYPSMGRTPSLVLLGDKAIDDSIKTVFSYQKQNNYPTELLSLPEYTIDAIEDRDQFSIEEDGDMSEYIFSAKTHALLEGSEMSHIRWRVSQFSRSMVTHAVETVDIPLDSVQAKLLLINSLHTWKSEIYKNDHERLEGKIINNSLLIAESIDLQGFCLFIDKELEGFALYKPLPQRYVNVNHIKVSYRYPHIFRYMLHALAIHLQNQGYEFLNGEMDLGIEGLRTYKMSLRPIHQLKKYNLYPS